MPSKKKCLQTWQNVQIQIIMRQVSYTDIFYCIQLFCQRTVIGSDQNAQLPFMRRLFYHNSLDQSISTRQSAQWGTYTPEERYRQFLTSSKYVALTLEMAGWMNSMLIAISPKPLCRRIIKFNKSSYGIAI